MYVAESRAPTSDENSESPSRTRKRLRAVPGNVVALGFVSMFTDVSSEMVSAILPIYLVLTIGLSPLAYGAVDGIYQGASALVRVIAGLVSDRWRRHKEVAGFGYLLSAIIKPGLLLAGSSVGMIGALVLVDRTGKGLRTAPRDALISLSTKPAMLGTAFGVHRALDNFGAMLGPLLAFIVLLFAPGRFDTIFVVSFAFAMVGVTVLVLFVKNRPPREPTESVPSFGATVRKTFGMLRQRNFRRLVVAAALLSTMTISDAFIYLALQRTLTFDARYLPLLYVATALAFMVFAAPLGRLADHVGRIKVFVGGYGLLLVVYSSLIVSGGGLGLLVGYLVAFGAFYAATDGVIMAAVAERVPEELRAGGMAVLTTATGLARFFASLLFGALWTWVGLQTAVLVFGVGLVSAMVFALVTLRSQWAPTIAE